MLRGIVYKTLECTERWSNALLLLYMTWDFLTVTKHRRSPALSFKYIVYLSKIFSKNLLFADKQCAGKQINKMAD